MNPIKKSAHNSKMRLRIAALNAKLQQPKKFGVMTAVGVFSVLISLLIAHVLTSHLLIFSWFSLASGMLVVTSGQLIRYVIFLRTYFKNKLHKDITKSVVARAISKESKLALLKWCSSLAFFAYTLTLFINTQLGYQPSVSNVIFSFFGFMILITPIGFLVGTIPLLLITGEKLKRAGHLPANMYFTHPQEASGEKEHTYEESLTTKALRRGPNSPEYIILFGPPNGPKQY